MTTGTRLRVADGVAEADWDRWLDASDDALVFHRSTWLDVMSRTQGASLHRFGIYDGDDRLVGVAPVLTRRFGPFRVGGSPLVVEDTPYLGPAVAPELLADALLALRDGLRGDASFVRMLLPYAAPETASRALAAGGFTLTRKTTHRLDLSPGIDALWKQAEGRCRTAVRRAEKGGVVVERVLDPDERAMRRYYALAAEVYGRQGRDTPNPIEFYLDLWRRAAPLGLISLFLATVNGEDVAGVVIAHDARRVYYLDGASAHAHRQLNASNLVLWKAIEWSVATGRTEFDFVGSDIPRLARFKESFGGKLTEHTCVEWARSRSVQIARDWYGRHGKAFLSRLRRKPAATETET